MQNVMVKPSFGMLILDISKLDKKVDLWFNSIPK